MVFFGENVDGYMFFMVLKVLLLLFISFGSLCRFVYVWIIKGYVELDDVLVIVFVDVYVKSGKLECVRIVFEMMKDESVVCFILMILGYMN